MPCIHWQPWTELGLLCGSIVTHVVRTRSPSGVPDGLLHRLGVHSNKTYVLTVPQASHLRLNSQIEMDLFIELGEVHHLQHPGIFRVGPRPLISSVSTFRFSLGFESTDSGVVIDAEHEFMRECGNVVFF